MKKNLVLLFLMLGAVSMTFAQTPSATTNGNATYPNGTRIVCPDGSTSTDFIQTDALNGVFPSQYFEAGFSDLDITAFDAFVAGATGSISEIVVVGAASGFYDAAATFIITIYADAGGAPGAVLCTETVNALAVDPGSTGSFIWTPSSACLVTSGTTYWMSVVGDMDFGTSGQWFWATNTNGAGNAIYSNPADGWNPIVGVPGATTGGPITEFGGTDTNMAFDIAICPPVLVLVPTMTQWGLFLFGLAMLTLGLVFVYNKQRQLA